MYKIKESVDLKSLEKYGFKIGREIPDNERCICNDYQRNDYWLIPVDPDEPTKIYYADEEFDQPIWEIWIRNDRIMIIDCTPASTYHIGNMDMEQMFYVLKCMIEDGIIEDNFNPDGI